jgi:CheY-like chemotaxis protein
MHGGGVSLESEVGKGSCFIVTLPWKVSAKIVEPDGEQYKMTEQFTEPVYKSQFSESPVLLLAEDNEVNIATYVDYLQIKGYILIVARNGIEAIELARKDKPDLILMDIQMPRMDGLEAIQRIRADVDISTGQRSSHAKVPIIALTALAMSGDRELCIEAGANEYLSKPVSLKRLISAIEEQLS